MLYVIGRVNGYHPVIFLIKFKSCCNLKITYNLDLNVLQSQEMPLLYIILLQMLNKLILGVSFTFLNSSVNYNFVFYLRNLG